MIFTLKIKLREGFESKEKYSSIDNALNIKSESSNPGQVVVKALKTVHCTVYNQIFTFTYLVGTTTGFCSFANKQQGKISKIENTIPAQNN